MAIGLAAVSEGSSLITENIFDGRFMFVNEMVRLGADIRTDGHHAVVRGPGAALRRAGAGHRHPGRRRAGHRRAVRRGGDRGRRGAPHRPGLPGLRRRPGQRWGSRWSGRTCPSRPSTSERSAFRATRRPAGGPPRAPRRRPARRSGRRGRRPGWPGCRRRPSSSRISSATSGVVGDRGRAEQAVVLGFGEDRPGRTASRSGSSARSIHSSPIRQKTAPSEPDQTRRRSAAR